MRIRYLYLNPAHLVSSSRSGDSICCIILNPVSQWYHLVYYNEMSYQKAAGWSPRSCITYHPNVFEHNILVVMFHPAVGSKYEMRRMNVLIYYLLDHLLLFETLILSEYIGRAYWNESYLSTDLNCYLIWAYWSYAYLVRLICRNEWLVVFMCR